MPTQEDLKQALEIALSTFRGKDPELQARNAGIPWGRARPEQGIPCASLFFLGKRYEILSTGDINYCDSAEEPALWEKILLLHYFNRADGTPLTGRPISFSELPEGRVYAPNFEKRVVSPLLQRYGPCPEEVVGPAQRLEAARVEIGDLGLRIPLLPRVPVTLVFWKADAEFGPRLSVLFDSSVAHYLPTEDIVLSAQMMALRLVSWGSR
jgi:hypothetical protein